MFIRGAQQKEQVARRKISKGEWIELLKEKGASSQQLKLQVLNFLGVCGNYELMETFSREAGINSTCVHYLVSEEWKQNKENIQRRYDIRKLVSSGNIDGAVELVLQSHEKFPEEHESILFTLKLLKVIRLIQEERIMESIELAQKELVPMAKGKPQYITEIEKVMTLVAFKDLKNCPNHYMCEQKYQQSVAYQLNEVLTKPTEVEYLTSLAKLEHWCQERLRQHLDFPLLDPARPQLFQ